jgi:thioesterase domain-containing protein
MIKDIEKILQKQTQDIKKEFKLHTGVLKEHFDEKVELIAEQHKSIKQTLDQHTRILESHTEILESHTEILDKHSEILDKHSEVLESHTEMTGSIKEDVEIIKLDTHSIKGTLKQKVDVDDFNALKQRVTRFEVKVGKG